MDYDPRNYISDIVSLAQKAGQEILNIYRRADPIQVMFKADNSPVTEADLTAHEIIAQGLESLTPDIPLLSEEGKPIEYSLRKTWDYYWLVDPLDGTREFINKSGEFTVNIALIHNSKPILGVIYAPMRELTYYGCVGSGAYKINKNKNEKPIFISAWELGNFRIVASRHHRAPIEELLEPFGSVETTYRGSSLKFCLVGEGKADIYVRLSPIKEWDTGAGQCIVEQAGGLVLDLNWQPMRYNTKSELSIPAFIVVGDAEKLLPILKSIPPLRR